MPLDDSLKIAAAGMQVQGERLRVVAENIANADATAKNPNDDPYRRKTVIFQNVLDKEMGMETVKIVKRGHDMSDFNKRFDPSHPAADAQGYVRTPNVNPILEMTDMREANRSYEANLDVVQVSKAMLMQTISLLNN